MSDPVCFVMAHGRGVRLHSEAHGACKGLLPLDESTTIVSNLLAACEAGGLDPIVTVRSDDSRLAELAANRRSVTMRPRGYIVDIAHLSEGFDDIIVVDCDTVAETPALVRAMQAMLNSRSDCTLTVAKLPLSDDPRMIRPLISHDRIIALSHDSTTPRTTGIYRFAGDALAEIRDFVAHDNGTFHDFMEGCVRRSRPMELHVMDFAFNVNWPHDYHAARDWWARTQARAGECAAVTVGEPAQSTKRLAAPLCVTH